MVPGCVTLRENTINRLKEFAQKGGKIFWLGQVPEYMDAAPIKDDSLQKIGILLPYTKRAVYAALEPWRTVGVCDGRGMKSTNLISQMRQDGENRWLFLSHCEKPQNLDDTAEEHWTIRTPGAWRVELYDALEGNILPVQAGYSEEEGCTKWDVRSYAQDSFLYCLRPESPERETEKEAEPQRAERETKLQ